MHTRTYLINTHVCKTLTMIKTNMSIPPCFRARVQQKSACFTWLSPQPFLHESYCVTNLIMRNLLRREERLFWKCWRLIRMKCKSLGFFLFLHIVHMQSRLSSTWFDRVNTRRWVAAWTSFIDEHGHPQGHTLSPQTPRKKSIGT